MRLIELMNENPIRNVTHRQSVSLDQFDGRRTSRSDIAVSSSCVDTAGQDKAASTSLQLLIVDTRPIKLCLKPRQVKGQDIISFD